MRNGGGLDGLSKFHRSILSQTSNRQRFVTGKYPITVTVSNNPTRRWLQSLQVSSSASSVSSSSPSTPSGYAESFSSSSSRKSVGRRYEGSLSSTETSILVNGTSPIRSLASFDRFQWLDDAERERLRDECSMVSVELISVVHVERPGYLSVLPRLGAGSTAAAWFCHQQTFPLGWKRWGKHKTRSWSPSTSPLNLPDDGGDGDRLWVTGFSLAGRKGLIKSVDASTSLALDEFGHEDDFNGNDRLRRETPSSVIASVNARTSSSLVWPNEVASVPRSLVTLKCPIDARPRASLASSVESGALLHSDFDAATPTSLPDPVATLPDMISSSRAYQDALLVCDGFLIPGKDHGGIYIVKNPGNPQAEWTVRLTPRSTDSHEHRWFYHRASWIDLTGDGRLSILTARCRISTRLGNREVTAGIKKTGQLVWLECPRPASIDAATGTLLESDGTVFDPFASRHLPWREHVLQEGPDVMFCVADMDTSDETVEVVSSQFFAKRVVLQSIRRGPRPEIVFRRVIDYDCGAAFGCILADLDGGSSRTLSYSRRSVVDSGSTVPTQKAGDTFSHLLVTSHERNLASTKEAPAASSTPLSQSDPFEHQVPIDRAGVEGGSLFAYRVPSGKDSWKTEPWLRTTVATGFQVNGQLSNMINPGAPGFVYTFHARESDIGSTSRPLIAVAGDCAESAYVFRPDSESNESSMDPAGEKGVIDKAAQYKLMLEIKCESTVGSIAIGYDEFSPVEQESGFAKIFVPCFEKDKVLVFALGSGDDEDDGW